MSINITDTNRVGELPPTPILMANKIPHEAGTNLGRATVQELADLIKDYIGTSSSLAFNPTTVTDGGNLPATTSNEWMLVGKGTFNNVGGGEQIICTEELSAITSNGSFWSISVEIPINVELAGIVQNIRSGYLNTVPSEDAVFNALVEKIGDVSDNKIYARTQGSWVEIDLSTSSIEVDDFEYTTGLQQFNLSNTASQILSVSVNGWSTENYTVINSDTILINDVIGTGQQVVIRYLTDLTTGISPYYTKLQTDALIAGVGGSGGGVITGDYAPVLTMHQNILSGTVAGASFSKSNNLVTLHLYIEVVLSTSGQGTLRVTVPTQYPIADVPENLTIGSGTLQNNGYNHIFVQKQSATTLNLNFIANISSVLNGIMYATVTYKTT